MSEALPQPTGRVLNAAYGMGVFGIALLDLYAMLVPLYALSLGLSTTEIGILLGARWSYPDLSLFQLIEGLRYAFPKRMAALAGDLPHLFSLSDRVRDLPELADYLASERRIPFNEDGIFRHYPELDAP